MEIQLAELAARIGASPGGEGTSMIRGAAAFEAAGPDEITFADSAKVLRKLGEARAGAVIVPPGFSESAAPELVYAESPRLAFARALQLFFPPARPASGISPMASIGENFKAGPDVSIGPMVAIGADVVLGARVWLHSGVVVGDQVEIGDDTVVYPNTTILSGCRIGRRVIIHAGTVIGSDGYGFVPDGDCHVKIPQTGIVQIDDDVEIGALNAVDRATFGRTWIKSGVKTDNQVHIGHNVTIGENSLVVAQVGIAGSAEIGKHVTIAGQAGVGGHIRIGDNAVVGPQAGVARSVPEGRVVSGTPEMPHRLWLKVGQLLPRLPEIKKRVDQLEAMVKKISGTSGADSAGGETSE